LRKAVLADAAQTTGNSNLTYGSDKQFCIIFTIFQALQLQYLTQEQTDCVPEASTVKFQI